MRGTNGTLIKGFNNHSEELSKCNFNEKNECNAKNNGVINVMGGTYETLSKGLNNHLEELSKRKYYEKYRSNAPNDEVMEIRKIVETIINNERSEEL